MNNFISQEKVLYELSKAQADKRFKTNYDFAILYDNILHIPVADMQFVNKTEIDGNELFKRIAGHSYYKGDDILTRISLMQEGKLPKKDIKPAADVRPVVKGEWLEPDDDYGYFVCSVCEERSPNDERWNFCPNCGADMREIKDD